MKHYLIILALSCAAFGQTAVMGSFTVATLPAAGNAGRLAFVTDATGPTTCAAGSGSVVVLCKDSGAAWAAVNTAVVAAQMPALTGDITTSAGNVATSLAAPFKKRSCEFAWSGSGTAFALTAGDDAAANNSCFNKIGVTETIVAVYCKSDAASNTTTINPTFGATGTGTTILSGALTCGSSEAYSSSGTVSNGALTDGSGIRPVMGGTLTGTNIHVLVVYTVPAS